MVLTPFIVREVFPPGPGLWWANCRRLIRFILTAIRAIDVALLTDHLCFAWWEQVWRDLYVTGVTLKSALARVKVPLLDTEDGTSDGDFPTARV
jgi:hypothetical protein